MIKYKRDATTVTRRIVPTLPRRTPNSDFIVLDHLLSTMPDGFAFLDRQFRFVRVSRSLAQMDGFSIEAHVGRTVSQIVGAASWRRLAPFCAAALEGRPTADVDVTTLIPHVQGERQQLVATFEPITAGGRITGVAMHVEVIAEAAHVETERLRLVEQIQSVSVQRRCFLGEMLAALTEGKLRLCHDPCQLPEPLTPVAPPIALSRDVLSICRHQVMDAAARLKFDQERTGDAVLAVGEAIDNALVHGRAGTMQVFVDVKRGKLQVCVADSGPGIDEKDLHRAALERGYTTAGSLGHGFYMILQTCDRIWLLTGDSGTTLVLEQDKNQPVPVWLCAA